jgi:asparagine synthase (glutamine-hydrolysing)
MMRFAGRMEDGQFACSPSPERFDQYRLLWRGFIANRPDILSETARRGAHVRSGSEGELFALAYRWWGDALQSHVLGEYSLAIFDEASATLFLTHDAFGLVPMFYGTVPAGVRFASHLEDLAGNAGLDDLDEEYVADYIADCFYSSERTPYRSIRRVGFGRSIICRSSGIIERRSWNFSSSPSVLSDDRDYEERFRSLLSEAVANAAGAQGPVWTELSGGLDSSTVACFAGRTGVEDIAAISLVYQRYAKADESNWMQLVIDHCPMPWSKLDGDEALPFCELPDRFCAEPGLPMIDWGWRRRYEEMIKAAGIAAVLTGQGGDFVLFGLGTEPYYLADLLRTFKPARLYAELAIWQSADRQKRSLLFWLMSYCIVPFIRYMRRPPRRPGRRPTNSPWIDTRYAQRMALDERVGRTLPGDYRSVERCWFVDTLSKMCGRIANLNQLPESFEFRHPLLYRPLVEFMLALPSDQKFSSDMNRFLQRRALKSLLPEALRLRSDKTTFDQPFYEGLRKGKTWTDLLSVAPRVVERGIVDGARWIEALAQAKLGRTHSLAQFQAIATLEIWLRQMENRKPDRPPEMPVRSGPDLHRVADEPGCA